MIVLQRLARFLVAIKSCCRPLPPTRSLLLCARQCTIPTLLFQTLLGLTQFLWNAAHGAQTIRLQRVPSDHRSHQPNSRDAGQTQQHRPSQPHLSTYVRCGAPQ